MAGMTEPMLMHCMFSSDAAEGGRAQVRLLSAGVTEEAAEVAIASAMNDSAVDCVAVFIAGVAGHYRAEAYHPDGHAIQFCGHGALAAAFHVYSNVETEALEMKFFNRRHQWIARRAEAADADITLIYTLPHLTRCSVPAFAQPVMHISPVNAAELGGAQDYLVLEFASPADVRDLAPDFVALSAATSRAVIATARDDDSGSRAGIVFRYFAPQYGQPEDTATGSAAVQLGAYWAECFDAACFSARQLSAGGALMQIRCQGDAVELSARVAYGS